MFVSGFHALDMYLANNLRIPFFFLGVQMDGLFELLMAPPMYLFELAAAIHTIVPHYSRQ